MKSLKSIRFFALASAISMFAFTAPISSATVVEFDVDSSHPNYDAIMYLMDHGIVDGYSDGTIKPDQEITRAELLKIFVEASVGNPETLEYNRCFNDIEILEWYVRYVCYAKSEGWVEGYEDGSFKPADSIDNIETLAMLFRTQGFVPPATWMIDEDPFVDVSVYDWYGPDVWYAQNNGIIDGDSEFFYPGTLVTRGEAFEMLYRTLLYKTELSKPIVYSDETFSFTHSGFYTQMTDEYEDDAFFDTFIIFTNEQDDGIAFIDVAQIELLEEETETSLEELLEGMDGIHTDDIEVKKGKVIDVNEYNEFFDTFDREEGTFLFKVEPVFGNGDGMYVIAHYSNKATRAELIDMFKTISVK